ncbi:VOC family virulence protein [Photobacterium kishitanii]|uniref:VOC family protein n=1 Tax=Photobacterium kishitanii TaxID=318456 RepID=UPI000D17022D|nr:VOC family protein [Photobacterium kishitanii]PSW63263.1 VOC family virulence protein [Photobacterium kishitanii]
MNISHLDHLVLTVTNIDISAQFYQSVLGMQLVTFGDNRIALTFGNQKINLHQHGEEFEPKAKTVQVGSADLCFITDTSLDEVRQHLEQQGVKIIEGPVGRTGAIGKITSLYFRDPDGNLIEVSTYLTV